MKSCGKLAEFDRRRRLQTQERPGGETGIRGLGGFRLALRRTRLAAKAVVLCVAFCAEVATSSLALAQEGKLSPRTKQLLEASLMPAYARGDSLGVLRAVSPMISRMDEQGFASINEYLEAEGVPALDQLLLDSRIGLISQNLFSELPAPAAQEAVLLVPAIKKRIESVKSAYEENPVVAGTVGDRIEDLDDYEDVFWDLHVLKNQIQNSKYLAAYADSLLEGQFAKEDMERAMASAGLEPSKELQELDRLYREIDEQRHVLRLDRLNAAEEVLKNSIDIRERFLAAFCLDIDGEQLKQFFAKESPALIGQLRIPGLGREVSDQVGRMRELAGDLVLKSRLLYTGLHWWMRGRYGRGTDGLGLLKSQLALVSPAAQFGLFMPIETPLPTAVTRLGESIPEYPRRHHLIWMHEYRQAGIERSGSKTRNSNTSMTPQQRTELSHFY